MGNDTNIPTTGPAITEGERRVRFSFNPDLNIQVAAIKTKTAELIDMVLADGVRALDPRLSSLAATAFEEAAMWAVKLVTTPIVEKPTEPMPTGVSAQESQQSQPATDPAAPQQAAQA